MKPILYWSPDFYLSPETQTDYNGKKEREARKRCLFTKYFPKYVKKISLDLRNGSLKSKLKRTKIIQELQYPFPQFSRSYWRTLLSNKMKTLKTVLSFHQSPYQFAQKIKLLSGLKNLSIPLPHQIGPVKDKIRDKYLKLAFKKMNFLRNLQSLIISNLAKDHKALLEKLNSFSRLLSSLTTLRIAFDEPKASDPELLRIIQSQKNIINSMTSFDLGSLCSPSHHTSFQNLTNSCPKLQRLRFEFSCRAIIYHEFEERKFTENTFPIKTNYLAALKAFYNLKSLHLNIADALTCLKDLAFPTSVQNLVLNFEESLSDEIMLKVDLTIPLCSAKISQIFEENETLLQFYEKFRSLADLETLNIYFNAKSDPTAYQNQSYLLHSLLKRVPTLKSLLCGTSARCLGLNRDWAYESRDSHLPQFFESCHSFSRTLETIEIGHEKLFYSNFDLSASQGKFPQLSSLKITGQFEEYNELNPPILPLLEQLISLGDSLVKIKLLFTMTNNTVKSVLSLLQQISQVKMPEKLYLDVEIKFLGAKDLEDLKEGFEGVINELAMAENGYLKAKRTSLKIRTEKKSKEMNKFLNAFGERFEHFEVCPKNLFAF